VQEEEQESLSNPDVVTKYKAAAKIVNSEYSFQPRLSWVGDPSLMVVAAYVCRCHGCRHCRLQGGRQNCGCLRDGRLLHQRVCAAPLLCTAVTPRIMHSDPNPMLSRHACRAVGKEFKGKDIEKGIAVPTCISVNQ
jgi:hypothetical protein